jgi:hypothetical protein
MKTLVVHAALAALALSALGMMGCTGGGGNNNAGGQGGAGAQGGEGGAGAQGGAGGAQGGEGGAQGGEGGASQGGGGQGGTGGGGACEAQDAAGVGDCKLLLGVAWNGESCVEIAGCECAGADCDALFDSVEACKTAHAECFAPGPCAPEDAKGVGDCALFLGYAWNGEECIGLSGCECAGTACADLPMDLAVCQDAHADCAPSSNCVPQEAKGEGPCDLFWGYGWNGMVCVGISGCDCLGADCMSLFDTSELCEQKYASCQ